MAPPTAIDMNIEGVTDTQAIVLPDPLTTESVAGRRVKAPKMSGGVAAWASSDMWKTPVCSNHILQLRANGINGPVVP